MNAKKGLVLYLISMIIPIGILSMVLLVCIYKVAFAQDPGEPAITADAIQDFQVRWHGGDWETVTVVLSPISDQPIAGTHRWVAFLGDHVWQGAMSDSAVDAPRTAEFTINVLAIPDGRIWSFYELRWRNRAYTGTEHELICPWSELNKLYVINLQGPGKPQRITQ